MMAEGAEKIHFENHVIQLLEKMEKIPEGAKEVFLWDLIRTANGDLFDYRLESLADKKKKKVDTEHELFIKLVTNSDDKSLSIIDTGSGMSKDELIEGIGKISEDQVTEYKGIIDNYLMNGTGDPSAYYKLSEFCLGVYSAFMVAHKVVITTKKNGHEQYVWESEAKDGFFRIAPGAASDVRGTKVTLYLKHGYFEYLEESRLKELVGKHTFDLCPYPIYVSDEDEDERKKKKQRIAADPKKKEEELKSLQDEFSGLQHELCKGALHNKLGETCCCQ